MIYFPLVAVLQKSHLIIQSIGEAAYTGSRRRCLDNSCRLRFRNRMSPLHNRRKNHLRIRTVRPYIVGLALFSLLGKGLLCC
jgi:hypothetical protein